MADPDSAAQDLSEAEGQALLAEALRLGGPPAWRDLMAGREAAFLEWARHHPRLGVVVADAWADRGGACAKPGEAALLVLAALVAESREEESP